MFVTAAVCCPDERGSKVDSSIWEFWTPPCISLLRTNRLLTPGESRSPPPTFRQTDSASPSCSKRDRDRESASGLFRAHRPQQLPHRISQSKNEAPRSRRANRLEGTLASYGWTCSRQIMAHVRLRFADMTDMDFREIGL